MNIQSKLLIYAAKNDNITIAKFSLTINKILKPFGKLFAKLNPFKKKNSYDVNDSYSRVLNQALSHAARNLNSKMMELLVDNGADVNFIDKDKKSPLDHLAESIAKSTTGLSVGDSVKQISVENKFYPLKDRGAEYSVFKESMVDNFNNYALLGSAKDLNYGSMDLYLSKGADVNFVDEKGKSILDHVAESIAKSKNASLHAIAQEIDFNYIVKKLVERGAKYSKYKEIKYNPNHDVDDYRVHEIVTERSAKYLESENKINRLLLHAAENLNYRDPNMDEYSIYRTIDSYIRQGADVNFIGKQGKSALDYVAENVAKLKRLDIADAAQEIDSNDIVRRLVKRGVKYSAYKDVMMCHTINNPHRGFPYSVDEGVDDNTQSKDRVEQTEEPIYIDPELIRERKQGYRTKKKEDVEKENRKFDSLFSEAGDTLAQSVSSSDSEKYVSDEILDSSISSDDSDYARMEDLIKKEPTYAAISEISDNSISHNSSGYASTEDADEAKVSNSGKKNKTPEKHIDTVNSKMSQVSIQPVFEGRAVRICS